MTRHGATVHTEHCTPDTGHWFPAAPKFKVLVPSSEFSEKHSKYIWAHNFLLMDVKLCLGAENLPNQKVWTKKLGPREDFCFGMSVAWYMSSSIFVYFCLFVVK